MAVVGLERLVALLWQPIFRYNTRVKAVFIVIREF
jgi:hypothetical protein